MGDEVRNEFAVIGDWLCVKGIGCTCGTDPHGPYGCEYDHDDPDHWMLAKAGERLLRVVRGDP